MDENYMATDKWMDKVIVHTCLLNHFSCVQLFVNLWSIAPLPWDSSGIIGVGCHALRNYRSRVTGMGCHALIQRILPIQGLNLCLLCLIHWSVLFSSVTHSCPTLCDPVYGSTPGLPVHHQLPEFNQPHVHWVGDPIQPSHPLSSHSPLSFSLSQHQGLFKWVSCSHQVAKTLEFQLQHQSFQWIFRTDFL